nr:hypothetical protein [Bacillus subtilis]
MRHVHFMTKWMLAANGLYPWPALFTIITHGAPPTLPIHFYQFSSYARIHFAPMAVALNQRFFLINRNISSLHHLDPHDKKSFPTWLRSDAFEERDLTSILSHWKRVFHAPFCFSSAGPQTAKTYMLDRIEKDGTLYSYASATIFMVYSLLSLGVSRLFPCYQEGDYRH